MRRRIHFLGFLFFFALVHGVHAAEEGVWYIPAAMPNSAWIDSNRSFFYYQCTHEEKISNYIDVFVFITDKALYSTSYTDEDKSYDIKLAIDERIGGATASEFPKNADDPNDIFIYSISPFFFNKSKNNDSKYIIIKREADILRNLLSHGKNFRIIAGDRVFNFPLIGSAEAIKSAGSNCSR